MTTASAGASLECLVTSICCTSLESVSTSFHMHKNQCCVSTAGNPCFQVGLLSNPGCHELVGTKLKDQVSRIVKQAHVRCRSCKGSVRERILKGQLRTLHLS